MIFGPAVEEHVKLGMIEDKNVFRLLKLSLVPKHKNEFSEDALMMHDVNIAHEIALESSPREEVVVTCELDQMEKIVNVNHVSDIFQEYLCYLWDKVKLDIQQVSSLSNEDLQRVFASDKTAVSVAVPAIWSNAMIDQFRQLLAASGLPNTHIVSEPKCAAAVIALEEQRRIIEETAVEHQDEALQQLRKVTKMLLDLGHGTAVGHPLLHSQIVLINHDRTSLPTVSVISCRS